MNVAEFSICVPPFEVENGSAKEDAQRQLNEEMQKFTCVNTHRSNGFKSFYRLRLCYP